MSELDCLEVDMACVPFFTEIQRNGIAINPAEFALLDKEFSGKMEELQATISQIAGRTINPGSADQLEKYLYKDMGLHKLSPIAKHTKASGQDGRPERWTTNSDVLMSIIDKHPVIEPIIRWKEYQKLVTSYIRVLPLLADKDGRVRSRNVRLTRTATGRPSMSEPNLLAQPIRTEDARRVRRGFVAPKGKALLEIDLNQIEMRVSADNSQDPVMMAIYMADEDIHAQTASSMFRLPIDQLDEMKHRYPAKRTGFGILNLITAQGLLRELIAGGAKEWDETGCQKLIDDWFGIYQGIAAWIEQSKATARRYGKIEDMWGRVRLVPELISVHRSIREAGLRQAVNAPIQMGAAGVIKRIMIAVWEVIKNIKEECKPLLQIYDSLLFEVEEGIVEVMASEIKEVMETAVRLSIPIKAKAEVGKSWGQMEKVTV